MPGPNAGADRYFVVGETVHLRSRVSKPGGRTPIDPATVELTLLALEGVQTLTDPIAFIREREGEFTLGLATEDLVPGTYTVAVRHADGPQRVTVATDRFVLRAAA
jgi:hypothetical protein